MQATAKTMNAEGVAMQRKSKESEAGARIQQATKVIQNKFVDDIEIALIEKEKAKSLAKMDAEHAEAMAKAKYKAELEMFEMEHQIKMKKRRSELDPFGR